MMGWKGRSDSYGIPCWTSSGFGSPDQTLQMLAAEGQPLAALTGHRCEVRGAVELSDGRLLS
jgi:hypothetical protein